MAAPTDSQELNSYTPVDVADNDQVIFSDASDSNTIKRDSAINLSKLQKISWKNPVVVATTGPITLSNTQTIDGVTVINPDRVLVKDQAAASANGIYEVTDAGAWVRTTDMDSNEDYVGATVWVEQGDVNMDTAWFQTALITNGVNLNFKLYAKAQPINWKEHVKVASTANIDLSVAADPGDIDGVTLIPDDRILLKDQTTLSENGIYVTVDEEDPTTWIRSSDMNQPEQFETSVIIVSSGNVNSNTGWYETQIVSTVDTDNVQFVEYIGAVLTKSNMIVGGHDNAIKKFDPHFNVKFDSKAATTVQVNFETGLDDGSAIDGIVLATGDMILVKDQNDQVDFANMTNVGAGYVSTPTVSFDITGTNATVTPVATAIMSGGTVIGLLFSNPGAGMTKLPLIIFTGGTPSTPATADAVGLRASNGIYEVQASGQPVRSSDADTSNKVQNGMFTKIIQGTTNEGKSFTLTTPTTVVLDETSLHFEEVNFAKNYRVFDTLASSAEDTRTNHVINLGNTQVVAWRNAAGDDEVKLSVNANDSFVFNVDGVNDYVMTLVHLDFGDRDAVKIKDLKLNSDTTHRMEFVRQTAQTAPYVIGDYISKHPLDLGEETITKIEKIILDDTGDEEEGQMKFYVLSGGAPNQIILTLDKVDGIDVHSTPMINLVDPVLDQSPATKGYVDSRFSGVTPKTDCRVASTANIDLSVVADPSPIDGVTLANGNRILLKDQTTLSENGIYITTDATDPTTWGRSGDANTSAEVFNGIYTDITEGDTYTNSRWMLVTSNPITLNTTDLTFDQFGQKFGTMFVSNHNTDFVQVGEYLAINGAAPGATGWLNRAVVFTSTVIVRKLTANVTTAPSGSPAVMGLSINESVPAGASNVTIPVGGTGSFTSLGSEVFAGGNMFAYTCTASNGVEIASMAMEVSG